jgi:hypothetical protein
MINKNTPLSCTNGRQQGRSMEGGAMTAAATCRGRPNYCRGWQRQGRPVRGDTIHISVLTVVDEGGCRQRQWRWRQRRRLAAEDSANGSERQAAGLLPHCRWRRKGNHWQTMDDGWLKDGGRQNYLLKNCRSVKVA